MLNIGLAIVWFLLCGYDVYITQHRIKRFGLDVELSESVRVASKAIGPELGAMVAVMIPAIGLAILTLGLHLQWVLAMLVGFRLRQFFTQLESRVYEKEIKEFVGQLTTTISPAPLHPSQGAPLDKCRAKKPGTLLEVGNE